jgi:peptide chain release factor 3
MDLEGRDGFDILDELESKLSIKVQPLSWPISKGFSFKGVYKLYDKSINLFASNKTKVEENIVHIEDLNDPILDELAGQYANELRQDVELISNVYDPFDVEAYKAGKLAPVFFGSAMNNFGVRELLEKFIEIAPTPRSRETETREVEPVEPKFSGFVFKIHANIDPRHRDRIAFLRVCSGKFERNKFYKHVRLAKEFKYPNPVTFMAQAKSTIEEAYPGDVVGLYDTGNFKIGDTLTEGENMMFKGIPSFSPEIFKELVNRDPMKTKQLDKGIRQLTEEGVAQVFFQEPGSRKIVGTVGQLQFEVIAHRLEHEYGASCRFVPRNYHLACWITTENEEQLKKFMNAKTGNMAKDKDDNWVFLAETRFLLIMAEQDYPDLTFHRTSEFKLD